MLYGCSARPDECDAVRNAGFDYAELPARIIAAMTESEFSAFKKSLKIPTTKMNMFCPKEIVICGPGYSRLENIRYGKTLAERASLLGVKTVGIGSPMSRNLPGAFDRDLADRQMKKFLTDMAEQFAPFGITVCLEALAVCYCNTVNTIKDAVNIVREINSPHVKVVPDFYNMEHMGEADIHLDGFIGEIAHAHISDDDGSPTRRSYLKPEKRLSHQSRIRELLTCGYNDSLTLETDVSFNPARAAESLQIMKNV